MQCRTSQGQPRHRHALRQDGRKLPRYAPSRCYEDLAQICPQGLVKKDIDPLLVQTLDTRLVGPVPILHEEVGLFTGLFRMEKADRLEILLDVLGKLGEGAGVAALTSGVPIAKAAYDGLGRLLGMSGVEYRFGTRQGFKVGKGLAEPLRSGFIAFTGSAQAGIGQDLRVRGSRLVRSIDRTFVPVRDIDYCLLAIEHTAQR